MAMLHPSNLVNRIGQGVVATKNYIVDNKLKIAAFGSTSVVAATVITGSVLGLYSFFSGPSNAGLERMQMKTRTNFENLENRISLYPTKGEVLGLIPTPDLSAYPTTQQVEDTVDQKLTNHPTTEQVVMQVVPMIDRRLSAYPIRDEVPGLVPTPDLSGLVEKSSLESYVTKNEFESRLAAVSTETPVPAATPKPIATPEPTSTPVYTPTPLPTATPTAGPTPEPEIVPTPTPETISLSDYLTNFSKAERVQIRLYNVPEQERYEVRFIELDKNGNKVLDNRFLGSDPGYVQNFGNIFGRSTARTLTAYNDDPTTYDLHTNPDRNHLNKDDRHTTLKLTDSRSIQQTLLRNLGRVVSTITIEGNYKTVPVNGP